MIRVVNCFSYSKMIITQGISALSTELCAVAKLFNLNVTKFYLILHWTFCQTDVDSLFK